MIEEHIVTPPVRTPLMEEGGHEPKSTPTRDWWLYWNQLTLRGNQNAADIDKLEAADRVIQGDIAGLKDADEAILEDLEALTAELAVTIRYGTHAARTAAAPEPEGGLWSETDRGNVLYQARSVAGSPAWAYVAGTMTGTLSPDQRPTDLGADDTGFRFESTGAIRQFRWDGAAWVDLTAGGEYLYTVGIGAPTITTTPTAVAGLSLTLARPGTYALRMIVDLAVNGTDGVLLCEFYVNSSPLGVYAILGGPTGTRGTVAGENLYNASAGDVIDVYAFKTGGSGVSALFATSASLSATWIKP